jgi:hypothetical protein
VAVYVFAIFFCLPNCWGESMLLLTFFGEFWANYFTLSKCYIHDLTAEIKSH